MFALLKVVLRQNGGLGRVGGWVDLQLGHRLFAQEIGLSGANSLPFATPLPLSALFALGGPGK